MRMNLCISVNNDTVVHVTKKGIELHDHIDPYTSFCNNVFCVQIRASVLVSDNTLSTISM